MSSLVTTRTALHHLARFVLAADLEGTTELVTLRITPGGFGQPERLVDALQHRIRIDGTQLVVQRGQHEAWAPITTLTAAASFAKVALPGDAPAPDASLAIDAVDAATLAEFFASVDRALTELRRRHPSDEPTIVQLFPHHFDVAVTMREVNIGGSPGDADHDQPYVYVGPWNIAPNAMWNESWGASLPWTPATTAEQMIAFFEMGFAAAI